MKKIFIGSLLMVSMLFVGCSSEELPKIGPDKDTIPREELESGAKEVIEEESVAEEDTRKSYVDGPADENDPVILQLCKEVADEYSSTLKYQGNSAFFITSNKTKDECTDKTEILKLMKNVCDKIDAVYDRDYEVFYQTSDFQFVSLFRGVSDNSYYVVYFDEIIQNIYEFVQ